MTLQIEWVKITIKASYIVVIICPCNVNYMPTIVLRHILMVKRQTSLRDPAILMKTHNIPFLM